MSKSLVIMVFFVFFITFYAFSEQIKIGFNDEVYLAPSKYFSSFVGIWHIDKDNGNLVYAVDGRKWKQGLMAEGIAKKAQMLYGKRYAEFLDNIEAYKYFPLAIFNGCKNFSGGAISVSFKGVSGRIDQGAGIAFDIKDNGDYLVLRANPLEENLVLFRLKNGRRSSVKWIRGVKHITGKWYRLKVVVNGNKIEGYLDGRKYLTYENTANINGKVGLWSKADSYVFFDDFAIDLL